MPNPAPISRLSLVFPTRTGATPIIAVTERLPDGNARVLVCADTLTIEIAGAPVLSVNPMKMDDLVRLAEAGTVRLAEIFDGGRYRFAEVTVPIIPAPGGPR